MVVLADVLADLAVETAWLDATVASLDGDGWRTPTPAPGWSVAHQIAHLAWTDDQAVFAATDPNALAATVAALVSGDITVDTAAQERAQTPPPLLMEQWRAGRERLAEALRMVPDRHKLPWFGPPMSATSMATARLMETWAHGQDVADALLQEHPVTDGLRHVAYLAIRTRDFSFINRGLTPPAEPFAITLTAPDGAEWQWGPPDAPQRITGTARDLCLVATQRRHRADTSLTAVGADAGRWLDIAQAFAGPPGSGRGPGGPAKSVQT